MSTLSTRSNPYASPAAIRKEPSTQSQSGTRLFSAQQIGIASFLGSSLAGMTLAAINSFRLGKPLSGALSLLIGVLIVAAVFALAMFVPLPGILYSFAQMGITLAIAKALFGKEYEANEAKNVGHASGWIVAGVTTAWVLMLVAVFFALMGVI